MSAILVQVRLMRYIPLALLLLASSSPALAQIGVPPPPPTKAEIAAKAGQEKMICKKMPVTGSLVRSERKCMTKNDWDLGAQAGRAQADRMVDGNRSTLSSN